MFVYALFWDERTAAAAVQELLDRHLDPADIGVLMREADAVEESHPEMTTGLARGAAIGAVIGAVGGAVGIPAAGWLAVGPLLAALKGAFFGGAVGSLGGALGGLGFWREAMHHTHERQLHEGAVLIGVATRRHPELAEEALRAAGATEVHESRRAAATDDIRLRGKLGDDHRAIEEGLAKLAEATEAGDHPVVDATLREVEIRLRGHIEGEEQYLLSPLESEHRSEIRELRAEHERFLRTLAELSMEAELHTIRKERVDAFITMLRAHARREDERLYRWADELPEATRRSMASFHGGLSARLRKQPG